MKLSSEEIQVYGHKVYRPKQAALIRDSEKDMLTKDIAKELL